MTSGPSARWCPPTTTATTATAPATRPCTGAAPDPLARAAAREGERREGEPRDAERCRSAITLATTGDDDRRHEGVGRLDAGLVEVPPVADGHRRPPARGDRHGAPDHAAQCEQATEHEEGGGARRRLAGGEHDARPWPAAAVAVAGTAQGVGRRTAARSGTRAAPSATSPAVSTVRPAVSAAVATANGAATATIPASAGWRSRADSSAASRAGRWRTTR